MKHLRNFIAVIALVFVVFIVTNYSGQVQQQIGVKGASTIRNQKIVGNLSSDVGSQVSSVEKQAMQVNLSDVVNGLSRFRRIPQDITSIKNYAQEQIGSVLQSKTSKK